MGSSKTQGSTDPLILNLHDALKVRHVVEACDSKTTVYAVNEVVTEVVLGWDDLNLYQIGVDFQGDERNISYP